MLRNRLNAQKSCGGAFNENALLSANCVSREVTSFAIGESEVADRLSVARGGADGVELSVR